MALPENVYPPRAINTLGFAQVKSPDLFVFVSHVSEDRTAAAEIVEQLERRGIPCWIAPRDVNPGRPFDNEIAEAIETSRAMLLVFSSRCNESEYIRREVTVAGDAGKLIVPFRIEDARPKSGLRVRLSDLHWIDAFVSWEHAVDEFVRTINNSKEKMASAIAPRISRSSSSLGPISGPFRPGLQAEGTLSGRRTPSLNRRILFIGGAAALGSLGLGSLLVMRDFKGGSPPPKRNFPPPVTALSGRLAFRSLGHFDRVNYATFSPDGKTVVTASDDKTARLWDAESGKPVGSPLAGHTDVVLHALFSPDGNRVGTASYDGTARLWDAKSGEALTILKGHRGSLQSAMFSRDSSRIVTALNDETASIWSAQIWDLKTGRPVITLAGHTRIVRWATFSPDGKTVVTASDDKTARLWDAESGKPVGSPLAGHTDVVPHALFSPDGNSVVTASADKTARLWDAKSGEALSTLSGHRATVWRGEFSPDGNSVVTASNDKTARLWDAKTGVVLSEFDGHAGWVTRAVFSPNGSHVGTASWDKTARIWDAKTGGALAILDGHTDRVNSTMFSPNGGRIVTASGDTTARVWDVAGL